MYEGTMSMELGELIDNYLERFKDDPRDRFSFFYTLLAHDDLVARLERALVEGKPYAPIEEEWDEEGKRLYRSGEGMF